MTGEGTSRPRFCTRCGKPVTDEFTRTCSYCGASLYPAPGNPAVQKDLAISRQEFFNRATPYFASKGYSLQTQTDYVIAFLSPDRDVNWIIFLVLCCLGIVGALLYYFLFTHQHQVTITLDGNAAQVKVTAIGNTEKAKEDAAAFMAGFT